MEKMQGSVLVIFWLHLGWVKGGNQMEQSPPSLRLWEGDSTSMSCTHSLSVFNGLQWYRQDSGTGLGHLFSMYSAGDVQQKGRLRAMLLKGGSSLNITAVQHGDSATYLCAVDTQSEAQCSQGTCSLSENCSCTCNHSLCLREDLHGTAMGVLIHTVSTVTSANIHILSTVIRLGWTLFLTETLCRKNC
uniref:Ig-like domain-containing protein n=1 Tax=Spermophilus dauricus TaxID=99837 RepID=A0A8C9QBI3_SPEDA